MEIRVQNITKYLKGIACISEVSFSCRGSEIMGVLAPRGNGKTLLLQLLRGSLQADSGTIDYFVSNQKIPFEEIVSYIGFLATENALYEDMSVYDYLNFSAKFYKLPTYLREDRLRNLIKTCGLSRFKHCYLKELSLGQKKRVGLAQCLVHNPPFLFLDEPLMGLDPIQTRQLCELIKEIGKDRAVLLTSSDMQEIELICDNMLVLSNGKVLAMGTVQELKQEVANSSILKVELAGITDFGVIYKEFEALSYIRIVSCKDLFFEIHTIKEQQFAKDLQRICQQNNCYVLRLVAAEKSLEDIFNQLRKY